MKKNKLAFSLAEILIVIVICSFMMTAVYRMFSHGFSFFTKGQAKLSNLRTASVIIEQLKSDIRSTVLIPHNDDYEFELVDNKHCKFPIENKNNKLEQMVEYIYDPDSGYVTRKLDGIDKILNKGVKIKDMKFTISEQGDKSTPFIINITVDKDIEIENEKRSSSNKSNIIELKTILYPKFYSKNAAMRAKFEKNMTEEAKFWRNARKAEID